MNVQFGHPEFVQSVARSYEMALSRPELRNRDRLGRFPTVLPKLGAICF